MAEYICEIEKEDMYFQRYGELKQRLVRCKDCKIRGKGIACHYATGDEWFCADGVPKEGEQE